MTEFRKETEGQITSMEGNSSELIKSLNRWPVPWSPLISKRKFPQEMSSSFRCSIFCCKILKIISMAYCNAQIISHHHIYLSFLWTSNGGLVLVQTLLFYPLYIYDRLWKLSVRLTSSLSCRKLWQNLYLAVKTDLYQCHLLFCYMRSNLFQ